MEAALAVAAHNAALQRLARQLGQRLKPIALEAIKREDSALHRIDAVVQLLSGSLLRHPRAAGDAELDVATAAVTPATASFSVHLQVPQDAPQLLALHAGRQFTALEA